MLLVIGTIVVATTWTENYGDQFSTGFSNFRGAVSVLMSSKEAATATATFVPRSDHLLPPHALSSDEKVALLGLIQSCFESAMYLFVFEWTPALEATLSPDLTKTVSRAAATCTALCCPTHATR